MQLDTYLSTFTRRLGGLRGLPRLTRPVRGYYARKYAGRPDRLTVINDYDGDLKMALDRSTYIGGSIYWQRYHHVGELRYLKCILRPDMTFLDVGANQGEFALPMAKRLTRGLVLAFEPEQRMFAMLERNVALNRFANVRLFPYGLGRAVGRAPLYTSIDTALHAGWNEGLFTTYPNADHCEYVQDIEVRPLDDVLAAASIERIDIIKIDVEGAELFVLEGARETLRRFKPLLMLEINAATFAAAGYSTKDLLSFVGGYGYRFSSIHRSGASHAASEEEIISDPRAVNILCHSS